MLCTADTIKTDTMYEEIKQEIDAKITTNGTGTITGKKLNETLHSMVGGMEKAITVLPQSLANEEKKKAQANLNDTEADTGIGKLGYKVLQPDEAFSAQIAGLARTIFEVRDAYDLEGASVTIPSYCVLKFNGGIVKNGIIKFDNTLLEGDVRFEGCSFSADSTVQNECLYAKKMGAKTDGTPCNALVNNLLDINGVRMLVFEKGTYTIDGKIVVNKDSREIVLENRAFILKDSGNANQDPAIELYHMQTSIRGAGRNSCGIVSADDSPKGVVSLGFRGTDDAITRTITNCSITGVRISGKANGGNSIGDKDVCLYMCNPFTNSSSASYFHRISDVSFTKANVGIMMVGDVNGNQFSELYFENIDNGDTLQGGAILSEEYAVASGGYMDTYVRHPSENYLSGLFHHNSSGSVTLRVNGRFEMNVFLGIISEPSGSSKCIVETGGLARYNTMVAIDNNTNRNTVTDNFYKNNNFLRYDTQNFFNLIANKLYAGELSVSSSLAVGNVKRLSKTYDGLAGTSSSTPKYYRFFDIDYRTVGQSRKVFVKVKVFSHIKSNNLSSTRLPAYEALYLVTRNNNNGTISVSFQTLYHYGGRLAEPYVFTNDSNQQRLGFCFWMGNTGTASNLYGAVDVEVELSSSTGVDSFTLYEKDDLVVVSESSLTIDNNYYSINKTGVDSNISVDNTAGSVPPNKAYLATLTPAAGYSIDTVSVTMGGVNVTDFVVSSDKSVVYVPNVIGNIVIIATAV